MEFWPAWWHHQIITSKLVKRPIREPTPTVLEEFLLEKLLLLRSYFCLFSTILIENVIVIENHHSKVLNCYPEMIWYWDFFKRLHLAFNSLSIYQMNMYAQALTWSILFSPVDHHLPIWIGMGNIYYLKWFISTLGLALRDLAKMSAEIKFISKESSNTCSVPPLFEHHHFPCKTSRKQHISPPGKRQT